jgi:type IV secretory pathway component VirB8
MLLKTVPNEIRLKWLFDIAIIFFTMLIAFLLPIILIYPYAKFEEYLIEKIIPKNIKIFFNIDKIEETYLPKEK